MRHVCLLVLLMVCLGVSAQTGDGIVSAQTDDGMTASRRYEILFHEAMLQRQRGHHDAAFDLLNRCLELKADAPETYFFLAQYYTEMKNPDRALEYFKKAATLSPDEMTYMETLAQSYISKGLYGDAISVVEKMYDRDKSRQELLEMLYRLYVQESNYEAAISVLDKMEAIDGNSERISLSKSALYLQTGDSEKAIDIIRTLAADHPNNAKVQQALRNYYIRVEDSVAVDSITRQILMNRNTETSDKIFLLRQLITENEQQHGDSTEILHIFSEMLQAEPDADIAELRAIYMDLKKMPRDSIAQALEHVLLLAPDRASARMHLVQFAWEADDDDRIVSLCQAARQYNPEEMAFYYYQGMAYYRKKDTDHALEAFQNGINVITEESSPIIVSDFYAVMGDILFQKEREREAFEAYDSCLQWKPDNIGCLNNYAYYLSLKGTQLDRAEQMSYKTIKAEPNNATYLDTYAWILFMQQRYAEARIYIDQALQNDSTAGAVVTEHAGDIYALAGDIEGAVRLWQQALAQDPGNKLLARKIKRKKYIKQ